MQAFAPLGAARSRHHGGYAQAAARLGGRVRDAMAALLEGVRGAVVGRGGRCGFSDSAAASQHG